MAHGAVGDADADVDAMAHGQVARLVPAVELMQQQIALIPGLQVWRRRIHVCLLHV